MAWYAWTATNVAGKTQRGTLQAEGPKQVRQALRDQKLIPVSITVTREQGGKALHPRAVDVYPPACNSG